jgi:hypothetical protein
MKLYVVTVARESGCVLHKANELIFKGEYTVLEHNGGVRAQRTPDDAVYGLALSKSHFIDGICEWLDEQDQSHIELWGQEALKALRDWQRRQDSEREKP